MFSEKLIQTLKLAKSVVVFTGAGISAESGVPTFRGEDGLWKKFKPEELANFDAFMRNPELVWEWYKYRKQIIHNIQPNPGHFAIVELEKLFVNFAVVTQNVDNLHREAGSKTVYELHGNIMRNYCIDCLTEYSDELIFSSSQVPRCNACRGMVRPGVVWFGELLPQDQWDAAEKASSSADVFISVGTSGIVYPAASLPYIAKHHGAFIVEVNPEPTPITDIADKYLKGKSGEILPVLVEEILRK